MRHALLFVAEDMDDMNVRVQWIVHVSDISLVWFLSSVIILTLLFCPHCD